MAKNLENGGKVASASTMTAFQPSLRLVLHRSGGLLLSLPICKTEYAWECYQTLGINIPHDPRGFVTPADFATDPKVKLLAVL